MGCGWHAFDLSLELPEPLQHTAISPRVGLDKTGYVAGHLVLQMLTLPHQLQGAEDLPKPESLRHCWLSNAAASDLNQNPRRTEKRYSKTASRSTACQANSFSCEACGCDSKTQWLEGALSLSLSLSLLLALVQNGSQFISRHGTRKSCQPRPDSPNPSSSRVDTAVAVPHALWWRST